MDLFIAHHLQCNNASAGQKSVGDQLNKMCENPFELTIFKKGGVSFNRCLIASPPPFAFVSGNYDLSRLHKQKNNLRWGNSDVSVAVLIECGESAVLLR